MSPRTPLEKFPEPDLGTARIPKDRYTSPDFARREWERMWTRTWQCAGPLSDLAEPGDYFTYEIGPESILVTRHGTGDGDIAAFFNVCQHRASQIRQPGVGHARSSCARSTCGRTTSRAASSTCPIAGTTRRASPRACACRGCGPRRGAAGCG